tara:strand:+ start:314 stop:832 length:519 start_codon:yes stop_codon:yes gene_type:complete
MKKNFNRHPIKWKKIYFSKGKKVIVKSSHLFTKKYNVHRLIQILPKDFKLLEKNKEKFTHFNIQNSSHKPGKNYIIVKINRKGFFNGKIYKQPVLNNKNFIFAKCLSVKNNIKYANLSNKDFRYSLSNIKNVNALKKAIKRRYNRSLIHLTDKEKLSLGVGITKLKIIKRFF